jgi:hypothetical protein
MGHESQNEMQQELVNGCSAGWCNDTDDVAASHDGAGKTYTYTRPKRYAATHTEDCTGHPRSHFHLPSSCEKRLY